MSEENVDLIRRMYDAWLGGRPEAFLALLEPYTDLHPDPNAYWVGVDRVYRGPEGFTDYMRAVYEAFADYRPQIEEFLDAGDKVITLAVESGRGRTSGAEVREFRTAHVWTVRDGKPVRLDLYLDRQDAFEAVGLREAES